jgi:hypothetical protein
VIAKLPLRTQNGHSFNRSKMWVLFLILALGGEPPTAEIPAHYATMQACRSAGALWLKPESNPMHTVRSFYCTRNPKADRLR